MNQGTALKRKVSNPNKARSPMKNIGFDFQYRSSAELAKQFQIKREKIANDCNDEVATGKAKLTHKRKNHMPITSDEGQSRPRIIHSKEQGTSKLPMRKPMVHLSPKEDLTTAHIIAKKGQSRERLIRLEESILKQRTSMIGRTQDEGEEHLNIQKLQHCKKMKMTSVLSASSLRHVLEKQGIHVDGEKQPVIQPGDDVRFSSSPIVGEHNVVEQEKGAEDECVRDEDMNIDCSTGGTSEKKKGRGKTTCKNIHARNFEEREEVLFDKGQAVGPTNKRVSDLSNFIGTIARNPRFITLTYTSWHAVPKDTKKRMFDYVNSKFIIPTGGEKWVIDGLRDAWKRHKMRVKKKHFDAYDTIDEMLENRPDDIPEVQFRQLIEYWKLPTIQALCHLNSQNRKKQKWRHRMGSVNFARVRMALRATKENNEEPSKSEIFIATRTKKGKEVHADTEVAISDLQNRQSSGETADEAFRAVFGKEQPGRLRCYGRSVTKSSLEKDEEVNKLKQKHANEIISLKEEMKEILREEMRNFLSQLVQSNPGLNIQDIPGCVGSNLPPLDTSSARVVRVQNLPQSSGSTHTPILEKEHLSDANGTGIHKSI